MQNGLQCWWGLTVIMFTLDCVVGNVLYVTCSPTGGERWISRRYPTIHFDTRRIARSKECNVVDVEIFWGKYVSIMSNISSSWCIHVTNLTHQQCQPLQCIGPRTQQRFHENLYIGDSAPRYSLHSVWTRHNHRNCRSSSSGSRSNQICRDPSHLSESRR